MTRGWSAPSPAAVGRSGPSGRIPGTAELAAIYDADTEDYLSLGETIYVFFMLGSTEGAHVDAVLRYADLEGWLDGRFVFDLGCGVGEVLRLMSLRWPSARYSGITISPRQHTEMRSRVPLIDASLGDFNRASLPEDVDLFISLESIGHVEDLPSFLEQCAASMRHGGRFLIQDAISSTGSRLIPSWGYRLRPPSEMFAAARAAGLSIRAFDTPPFSMERAERYLARSRIARQMHQLAGDSDGTAIYVFEKP